MSRSKLLVYGEQGLGDELMLATMLPDVMRDYEVVFDSHPRLQWLHENSRHAAVTLTGTRKVRDRVLSSQGCDAKVAIGNLARFYRTSFDQFPAHAHYTAPAAISAQYREHLTQLAAGRKIVGLATRGGLMQTARLYRMMPMDVLEQLFADPSLMFVSLDYEDMTALGEWAQQKYGANKFVWQPSILWHWQYEYTAALVAATDAVVTVPQTVAHLSAAMGHPTYVMTPSRPDWRLGLTGETWYWYPNTNTRLLRQQGQSWQPALTRLSELLQARSLSEAA